MDWKDVLKAIDAIYETPGLPQQWPETLAQISRAMDSAGALLLTRNETGALSTVVSPELRAAQLEYEKEWWQHDFVAHRAITQGFYDRGDIVYETDVSTEEERREHPFYADFRRRHGLGSLIAGSISPVPTVFVALSVQQHYGRPGYGREQADILVGLLRHCERALSLACRLEQTQHLNATLLEMLGRLNCGVFLVDDRGESKPGNVAAEGLLGSALQLVEGKLWTRDAAVRNAITGAIVSALRNDVEDRLACPRPIMVPRPDGAMPLVVYIIPIRTERAALSWSPSGSAAAMVLVVDLSVTDRLDPALVRDYLGLTLGEARIASQIGMGLTPRDAAEQLNISEHTVRSTLKTIFAKTGVTRQAELALLMARLQLVSGIPKLPD